MLILWETIRHLIDKRKKKFEEIESHLKTIDESIESIVEKSVSDDLTKEEIASIGISVLKPFIWPSKTKLILRFLYGIFFIFMLLFSIKTIEPLNRLTAMYGRILLFEVEPYWDWNQWYESSCLIYNPFYKPKNLKERDCYSCEDISEIERSDEIRSEIIAEKYIRNRIPVIIRSDVLSNEVKSWPMSDPDFGLDDIQQIYDENDWKNICMFRSNIKSFDHLALIKKLKGKEYSSIGWYAHWENCAKKTEKQMRRYYRRPSVLPSMLEFTKSNWIVVSNNTIGSKFKMIDPMPGTQVLLIFQIRGQNRVKLDPKEFCSSRGCSPIENVLHQNEMMIMSAELWQFSYSPNHTNFNLAIVIAAIYN